MDSIDSKKLLQASQTQKLVKKTEAADLALRAGLTRNEFFKEDTWIVREERCVAPKGEIPSALQGLFRASSGNPGKTESLRYDERKFDVESLWSIDEPRTITAVYSEEAGQHVAELNLDNEDGFLIRFYSPKSGIFPFTAEEFCAALNVAKWTLELDVSADERGSKESEEVCSASKNASEDTK